MDMWQWNAWGDAWRYRNADDNQKLAHAAFLTSYWIRAGKKGKSLSAILKALEVKEDKPVEKINKDVVADQFRQFEELQNRGWTQINNN